MSKSSSESDEKGPAESNLCIGSPSGDVEDIEREVLDSGDEAVGDAKSFQELGIGETMLQACTDCKFTVPTPIQSRAIPPALKGRDIIGLAQTGSGKTVAFLLPIVEAILKDMPRFIYAVIISPTRELAMQISDHLTALTASVRGFRSAVVVGGLDMMEQARALARLPHVIIATPGRLLDHLRETKGFELRRLRFLVLDEADKLLNLDFEKELNEILRVIPHDRQTMLFSATMTSKVEKLQRASLSKPVKVEVSAKYATVETLKQYFVFFPAKHKDSYLTYIVNEHAGNSMLVFCSTCQNAQRCALLLRCLGYGASALHGKMSQAARFGALHRFKSGEKKILVATDVASRGLDIPAVDLVINYDVPSNSKDYVHRVGRTARAGRAGLAVVLVTQYDVELFQRIESMVGLKGHMPQYPMEHEMALLLADRVSEAQRMAQLEMRKGEEKAERKGKRSLGQEEEDEFRARDPYSAKRKIHSHVKKSRGRKAGGRPMK